MENLHKKTSLIIFLGLLVSMLVSFLLYSNTLKGQFVYDDTLFAQRADLQQTSSLAKVWLQPYLPNNPAAAVYRPLTIFSLALNFVLFGSSAFSFHIVNILLNGLIVFLAGFLIFRLLKNARLAVLTALLFAFLPIHTEAVAYIRSRDELLATLFVILGWLLFLRGTDGQASKKRYYISLSLSSFVFFLALLSKELTIIIPMLYLVAYQLQQKISFRKFLVQGLFYAPSVILYFVLRFLALGSYAFGKDTVLYTINPLPTAGFWMSVWTPFKIAFIYIGKTLIPFHLSATYSYNYLTLVSNPFKSLQTILGILLLLVLVGLIFHRRTRKTPLAIGAIMFLIPYLIISKFIFRYGGEMVEEHWVYFPSLGLCLIVSYGFLRLYEYKKQLAMAIFLASLSIYSIIIISRNRVWLSNLSLYQNMIAIAPTSIDGHYSMATIYYDKKDYINTEKELKIAHSIYEFHPAILNMMGQILYSQGRYEEALAQFYVSVNAWPLLSETHRLFTLSLARLGRWNEIITGPRENLLRLYPNDPSVYYLIALSYYKLGQKQEAQKYFDMTKVPESQMLKILETY